MIRRLRAGEKRTVRALLRARDGVGCCWCGVALYEQTMGRWCPALHITIEHLRPLSMGGTDELDNLALACEPCNNTRDSSMGPPNRAIVLLGRSRSPADTVATGTAGWATMAWVAGEAAWEGVAASD